MDPITTYVTLFAVALAMCLVASALARKPSRACPSCGGDTPIDARRCRHCGYKPGRV
jgi:ribosomal protein L40E